jgi:hypothetical protein
MYITTTILNIDLTSSTMERQENSLLNPCIGLILENLGIEHLSANRIFVMRPADNKAPERQQETFSAPKESSYQIT